MGPQDYGTIGLSGSGTATALGGASYPPALGASARQTASPPYHLPFDGGLVSLGPPDDTFRGARVTEK
jgi:hypothetical protein